MIEKGDIVLYSIPSFLDEGWPSKHGRPAETKVGIVVENPRCVGGEPVFQILIPEGEVLQLFDHEIEILSKLEKINEQTLRKKGRGSPKG